MLAVVLLTPAGIALRLPSGAAAGDGRESQGAPGRSRPGPGTWRLQIDSLPPAARAQMSAAIGEDQPSYQVAAAPEGLRLTNSERGVSAAFTPEGAIFGAGAHQWGMRLRGYGYGDRLREVTAVSPTGALNRVEYRRGPMTEWYVNGPLGLEQGFTLERAPGDPNGQPLTLALAMSGDMTASVDPGGRSLTLRKGGSAVLRYGDLFALDADGRELRTWLEVTGAELRVRVDDVDARYPVTIDPYVWAVMLTTATPCDQAGVCDDGAPFDHFGYSVSISADASTIVIGAPYKYNNNAQSGVAYVFVRPDHPYGWNSPQPNHFKAKLRASDYATNGVSLGVAVAISHDGGTIAAGAPRRLYSPVFPGGKVYVFVRPSNGWGAVPLQTETARLTPAPVLGRYDNGSFGESVTISGDGGTIAAGSPYWNGETGATYLFLRPAWGWTSANESWKVTGTPGSWYGSAVALSADASTLVVGAIGESPLGAEPWSGAVHVLERRDIPGWPTHYAAVATLAASNGIPHDILGYSVGVSGNGSTVVAGAPGEPRSPGPHGAAYVFVRPAAGWATTGSPLTETARLTASDGNGTDRLGVSADISRDGNTIVATTVTRQVGGYDTYAAYFFGRPAAGWSTATEDAKVASPGDAGDMFGRSARLSANGAVAVVGAPYTVFYGSTQGAAYVFTGTVGGSKLSVFPANLTFGSQPVGTPSAPQTVTVTNVGSMPLHIAGVGVTGPFTSTRNCLAASPIAPGSSCSESVAFAPLSVGPVTGTLTFSDDSGGTSGATQVPLQGEGAKVATSTAIVSVSPNPLFVGGTTRVTFDVSAASGPSPSGPVTVQASTGESCTSAGDGIDCVLTFSTPGPRTVTATYHGSAVLEPSTSPNVLVGVVDFSLSASPSLQTASGRKATYKLTISGQGGLTGPVTLACAGGPPNATCAVSPSSLTLSGPTGDAKATLTIPGDAAKGTYIVTFLGTYGGVTRSTRAELTVK